MQMAWLNDTFILGIQWGELLGALAIMAAVALAAAACRQLFRRLDELCMPYVAARPLRSLVRSLKAPLLLTLWTYGLAAALYLLLPPLPVLPRLLVKGVAHGIGLLAVAWLFLRISRRLMLYLDAWAASRTSLLDRYFLPLLSRALPVLVPALVLFALLPLIELPESLAAALRNLVSLLLIGAIGWTLIQVVTMAERVFLDRYRVDIPDNLEARRVHTQIAVIRKIVVFIIVVLTVASMLMVFEKVRQLGASILASAGVLGVVLGFAAQRVLGNLLAGIQIALSQPIRLDDAVIVENEFGFVEELTLTYVVLRLWDQRRLVLPINYFIEKPFQNWTRNSTDLLGSVVLFVDYSVPIDALREGFERIVRESPLWDGKVCTLQVLDLTDRAVQVRGLVSAQNAGDAWDLRAFAREKLIDFLQREYPGALPKLRTQISYAKPSESGAPPLGSEH